MTESLNLRTRFRARMRDLGVLHRSRLDGIPSARNIATRAHLSPTTVGNWLNGARIPSSIDSLLAVIRCLREEAQRGERLTGEMRTLLDEERWREDYEDLRRAYAEDSREAAYRSRARAGDLRGETRTGRTITADITDFTALIDERTAEFVGRRRFIERLWSTLDDSSLRSGYLLVHGEPGIGKTALLAKLVRDRKLVHHFNSTLVGITSRERFLRNVCAQLILRFNLPHSRLPEDATSDSSFLVSLLVRAAEQERIVVAVDAIDEAVQDGNGQNRLFLPPALPPGVFFIVTMRDPDDIDLYVDEPRELPLLENNVENQADVEEYITAFLDRHHRAMTERLADLRLSERELTSSLVARSEGNFMYLRHVLRDIRYGMLGTVGVDEIGELPRGLRAYYSQLEDQLVRRIGGDPDRELAILGVLAAWPSPLHARRLASFAGESVTMTRGVLRRWGPFLNKVPVENEYGYALYHTSFREFLAERLDMEIVRERIHTAIETELL